MNLFPWMPVRQTLHVRIKRPCKMLTGPELSIQHSTAPTPYLQARQQPLLGFT